MKRILYLDDNKTNLDIFCEQFSDKFDITTSCSPLSIFNLLEGQNFDLILVDMHMPEWNGLDVIQAISESRFSSIPVLLYTSDELQVTRYQALQSTACDILYRTLPEEEIELRLLNKINLFSKRHNDKKYLTFSGLHLNLETLEAFFHDKNLNLTPIEFKILASLVKSYPEKISRDLMIQKAWNVEFVQDRTVNTHLANLRGKLPTGVFSIESPRATGVVLKKADNTQETSFHTDMIG